jgi:hypothetical protein
MAIVRFSPEHHFHFEWITKADIDHARIVWARIWALEETRSWSTIQEPKGLARGAACDATSFIGVQQLE